FAFFKAFLLDRDCSTIVVASYFEELSEQKTKEKFVELPLCLIKERYEKLPGGKELIADILKSQKGRKHPQSDDEQMKIYKVFDSIESSRALVQI
ncbi:NaCP60E, partial [Symbiodinium pilosum]